MNSTAAAHAPAPGDEELAREALAGLAAAAAALTGAATGLDGDLVAAACLRVTDATAALERLIPRQIAVTAIWEAGRAAERTARRRLHPA